jgi:hypothetical protein
MLNIAGVMGSKSSGMEEETVMAAPRSKMYISVNDISFTDILYLKSPIVNRQYMAMRSPVLAVDLAKD